METIMREAGIDSIDLLKMDAEGAEIEIFESCPWIGSVQVLAIELHDRIRSECSSVVKKAAKDLSSNDVGEVTFFAQAPLHLCEYSRDFPAGKIAVRDTAA
jgi:hypothetical protein